jgi:hypothetical protein
MSCLQMLNTFFWIYIIFTSNERRSYQRKVLIGSHKLDEVAVIYSLPASFNDGPSGA